MHEAETGHHSGAPLVFSGIVCFLCDGLYILVCPFTLFLWPLFLITNGIFKYCLLKGFELGLIYNYLYYEVHMDRLSYIVISTSPKPTWLSVLLLLVTEVTVNS